MADQGASYADAAERYRLDRRIATGGMGEVWYATDTVLDRAVAVKLLKQEHADDAVFRSRFEVEARHAAALRHPGVAQVFDFGAGDEQHAPFLVMEYVDGQPLSALLRSGEPMDPAAAGALLAGAADAIGAAHAQGIVHRDVKPGNLLVTPDHRVKITDFGIARAADGLALTRTGEVMGTPQYLSPEQAEGKPASPASDVYSLGAVAFECLVGRRPFVAESAIATALAHLREPVPELPDTVPPALADVVRRALAKDPDDRYADGTALATAIRSALVPLDGAADPAPTRVLTAAVPVPAPTPVGDDHGWRDRAARVPAPLWAVAGVFVLLVVVAGAANLAGGGGSTPTKPGPTGHTTSRSSTPSSTTTSATQQTQATHTPPTHAPKPPNDHGPKHGHKGKGHK
ncbi:protein kinase domain-containing protein [Nocardioides cynanchi]|uniref:protein kinase domain-containing protein n=1 Tax=Nocardioides cynanchi TaxID=2558918 RepID=UPI001246A8E4|nr:protein kinase [Nocardioides cynanchi]